ncbi:MAG: TerB family tellurite resistance protein [Coriobacteriales bacterium]|nr:TerB family tellurite resistance protein [Coriobacteriales bacterium]
MNTKAEIALSNFVGRFDAFLIDCSECEIAGKWNVRKNGYMAAYFEADLFAVVLQTMSVDGVFERAEAEVISRMFGTEYDPRELDEMYRTLAPVVDDYCSDEANDALILLGEIDPRMRDEYRDLILDACRVVSEADGVAEGEEIKLLRRLRTALEPR